MHTVVYEYGLQQPTLNADEVNRQIELANWAYDRFVRTERIRRYGVRLAESRLPGYAELRDEAEALEKQIEALCAQRKEAKSRDRRVKAPPKGAEKPLRARLKEIRAEMKALREADKANGCVLASAYAALDLEAEEAKKCEYKRARDRGLYWGTLMKTLTAFEAAVAATRTLAAVRKKEAKVKKRAPNTPRKVRRWEDLPRWRGDSQREGLIATQLQQGLAVEDVFGNDTRLQIDPLSPEAFDKEAVPSRNARRRLQYTRVRVRIGSTGTNSAPVWAEWPLWLHRPLPAGAKIKWAVVIRKDWDRATKPKRAMRHRWWLQLALDVPDTVPARPSKEMVALNRGWRKMEGGDLRVATWVGTDGGTGELRLPYCLFRKRIEKGNAILSVRDKGRNALQARLLEHGVPCARWKSGKRFLRHLDELEQAGEGQSVVAEHIRAWADRDEHLRRYQRGLREGALNYRRDQYRCLAKQLAERYGIIVADTYDLREIAEDENRVQQPSAQRVEGAPSRLANAVKAAAPRYGCHLVEGDVVLATQQCSLCGYGAGKGERWDASPSVMHTCAGCGETWDQDINHCRNLLARAKVMAKDGTLPTAPKPRRPARFAKRHKKQSEATA